MDHITAYHNMCHSNIVTFLLIKNSKFVTIQPTPNPPNGPLLKPASPQCRDQDVLGDHAKGFAGAQVGDIRPPRSAPDRDARPIPGKLYRGKRVSPAPACLRLMINNCCLDCGGLEERF